MNKKKKILNLAALKEYEQKYVTSMSYARYIIRKIYKDELHVGKGYNLAENEAKNELQKLRSFLMTDEFEKKYNRKFNIVDLYLTTNLQVCDFYEDYAIYIDEDFMIKLVSFIKNTIRDVDNQSGLRIVTNVPSKMLLSSRFTQPSQVGIDRITNLKLLNYVPINATIDDAKKAHEILLDLNDKYGVKYDDICLYIILRSVLNNEIDSYYTVAEDFKKELDEHTHVQKRCIPLLTRRERN